MTELMSRGLEHWRKGEHQAAERLLRRAAEQDLTTDAPLILGRFLIDTSYFEEATAVFKELLVANPDDPVVLSGLVKSLMFQERFDAASRCLEKVLAQIPTNTEALHLLTELAARTGESRKAIERLEQLSEQCTDTPEPLLALASLHEEEGRLAEAGRILSRALIRFRRNPRLLNRLGILNYNRKRYKASINCHSKALDEIEREWRDPEPEFLLQTKMNLANALCMAGSIERSLELYDRLLEEDPGNTMISVNRAITFRNAGRLKEARRTLEDVLERGQENKSVLCWLGIINLEENSPWRAEYYFRKAREQDGSDVYLKLHLALALKRQGRLEEALILVDDILFLNPDTEDAVKLKADILIKTDRPAEAASIYHQLHERNPNDSRLLNCLARTEALCGRIDKALLFLKQALRLDPENSGLLLETAEIMLLDGRKEECLDLLKQGLESKTLSAWNIRTNPGLDDIKWMKEYRDLTGGSLLDFADPWGSVEKRLHRILKTLPPSTPSGRNRNPLWRRLRSNGTLVGDAIAAVRKILHVVTGDFELAGNAGCAGKADSVLAEVHPLDGGIEIKTVFQTAEKDRRKRELPQAVFRQDQNTYLIRFHDYHI